jgi:2-amino-4-hydroxy-6-hydroxymethyldihydropteridine diphosphokinase
MGSNKVILSLGSNTGNRSDYIDKSVIAISKKIGNIVNQSRVYETDAWGYDDSKYLNMVVVVETDLSPEQVLDNTKSIEKDLGRKSKTITDADGNSIYSNRTIDIDILFYGDEILNSPILKIPHPNLHRRNFVLIPLQEVCPEKVHPLLGINIEKLLKFSPDTEKVKVFVN